MPIADLLNQTLTWTPKSTVNKYGEQSFGTAQSVRGRLEAVTKIIKGPQGEDIGTDAEFFMESSDSPAFGDKITYDSVDYRIIKIDKSWGRGAHHHWEGYLQRIAS